MPNDKKLDMAINTAGTFEKAAEIAHKMRPYRDQDSYWEWAGVQLVTRPDGKTYMQKWPGSSLSHVPSWLYSAGRWDHFTKNPRNPGHDYDPTGNDRSA